jgi:hypothetical protein
LIEALERSERGEGIRMSPDELRAELVSSRSKLRDCVLDRNILEDLQ